MIAMKKLPLVRKKVASAAAMKIESTCAARTPRAPANFSNVAAMMFPPSKPTMGTRLKMAQPRLVQMNEDAATSSRG